jgi:hypothetical protein
MQESGSWKPPVDSRGTRTLLSVTGFASQYIRYKRIVMSLPIPVGSITDAARQAVIASLQLWNCRSGSPSSKKLSSRPVDDLLTQEPLACADGTHKDRQWTVRNVIERLVAVRRDKIAMGTVEFEKVTTPEPDQQTILDYLQFSRSSRSVG